MENKRGRDEDDGLGWSKKEPRKIEVPRNHPPGPSLPRNRGVPTSGFTKGTFNNLHDSRKGNSTARKTLANPTSGYTSSGHRSHSINSRRGRSNSPPQKRPRALSNSRSQYFPETLRVGASTSYKSRTGTPSDPHIISDDEVEVEEIEKDVAKGQKKGKRPSKPGPYNPKTANRHPAPEFSAYNDDGSRYLDDVLDGTEPGPSKTSSRPSPSPSDDSGNRYAVKKKAPATQDLYAALESSDRPDLRRRTPAGPSDGTLSDDPIINDDSKDDDGGPYDLVPSPPKKSQGKVEQRIQQFEAKSGAVVKSQLPPMIDLFNPPAPAKRVANMKGKNVASTSSTAPLLGKKPKANDVTMEPTPFVDESSKKRKSLPLQKWYMGCNLYESHADHDELSLAPPFWLGWRNLVNHLTIHSNGDPTGGSVSRPFKMTEIERIVLSKEGGVMALRLKPGSENKAYSGFKPGAAGPEGQATFIFQTDHERWDATLLDEITNKAKTVNIPLEWLTPRGSTSLVQMLESEARMWLKSENMENDHVETFRERTPVLILRPSRLTPQPRQAKKAPAPKKERPPETPVRRSTRLSGASTSPPPDQLILVYPPSGPGAINITYADIKRLKPGEFLNDTLIEFGLKLWISNLKEKSPELADQIHVFSSFFYKKLNTKNIADGYESVKKWTNKMDLFKKRWIVVPINENVHWYLAVIVNPEYVLHPPPPQVQLQARVSTRQKIRESLTAEQPLAVDPAPSTEVDVTMAEGETVISSAREEREREEREVELEVKGYEPEGMEEVTHGASQIHIDDQEPAAPSPIKGKRFANLVETVTNDNMDVDDPLPSDSVVPSNGDSAQPDESVSEAKETEDDQISNPNTGPDNDQNGTTHIFTFDSLGAKHPQATRVLNEYLLLEAKDKKQLLPEVLTKGKGKFMPVPFQPNYCDCGVYLVHFAETFVKKPEEFIELAFSKKAKDTSARDALWEKPLLVAKRETLKSEIERLSEIWKKDNKGDDDKKEPAKPSGDADTTKTVVEDSDEDIVPISPVGPSTNTPATATRGRRGKKKGGEEKPAERIRG